MGIASGTRTRLPGAAGDVGGGHGESRSIGSPGSGGTDGGEAELLGAPSQAAPLGPRGRVSKQDVRQVDPR